MAITDFLYSYLVSQHSREESSGEIEALLSQITISNSIMMKNGECMCVFEPSWECVDVHMNVCFMSVYGGCA